MWLAAFGAAAQTQPLVTRDERSVLEYAVYAVCTAKAKIDKEFQALVKQVGRDITQPYCRCFAQAIASSITDAHVRYASEHQQVDGGLKAQITQQSQQCATQASAAPAVAATAAP